MNTFKKLLCVATIASLSSAANASYFQLDTGDNSYDLAVSVSPIYLSTGDADTRTGSFEEFGFSALLATSIYDMTDSIDGNDLYGNFIDTNVVSVMNSYGVTDGITGLSIDGTNTLSFDHPVAAETDIDALSPLVPGFGGDNEGFLTGWELQTQYVFEGTLTASGPVYTGGYFDVYFEDQNDATNNFKAFSGELIGSNLQAANLDLFLNLTYAKSGFLFSSSSENGTFTDVADIITNQGGFSMNIDTNVNPPIPTENQLMSITQGDQISAVRQTKLDGSITASVPEPTTLAILGLGLLGFASARRRKA